MTKLLKLLLSEPIPIILIIIGVLLAGSLAFEEYFGLKPRKETRKVTGFLGILILASGVLLIFLGGAQSQTATNICKKYGHYTAKEWRRKFLLETQIGTWHVFVASLSSSDSEEEAERIANQYRQGFPNHDFNVMRTVHRSEDKNFRYSIVIAEGLKNSDIAKEIAKYARTCGISPDAYTYQQNF